MTTIGGVVFRHLDRLPQVGDRVHVEGLQMTVLEMDMHRIVRVRVAKGESREDEEETLLAVSAETEGESNVAEAEQVPEDTLEEDGEELEPEPEQSAVAGDDVPEQKASKRLPADPVPLKKKSRSRGGK